MLRNDDANMSIPRSVRHRDADKQQLYLLRVRGEGDSPAREIEVHATNVVVAIERAVIVFGAGEVEIRSDAKRGYRLKIQKDRSWSLQPLYQL